MNILYVNSYYWGGGAEKVMRQLCNGMGMAHKDVNTFCIVGRYQPNLPEKVEVIYKRWLERAYTILLGRMFNNTLFITPRARKKIVRFVRENSIDIIHFHNIHSNYIGLREIHKIAKEARVVITLHDMWTMTGGCAYVMNCTRWIEKQCRGCYGNDTFNSSLLSHILYTEKKRALSGHGIEYVVPAYWLKQMSQKGFLKEENVCVVNNGITIQTPEMMSKEKLRKKYNLPIEKKILIFSANGVHNIYKGFNYLQSILEKIEDKSQCMIVFVGNKDGEEINVPIEKKEFGFINNEIVLYELLALADICLITSIAEIYPLSCLEAVTAGTPVVAFDVGGIREIVGKSEAYLVPPYDVDRYSDIINRCIAADDTISSIYEREKADSKYISLEEMFEQYYKIYTNANSIS